VGQAIAFRGLSTSRVNTSVGQAIVFPWPVDAGQNPQCFLKPFCATVPSFAY